MKNECQVKLGALAFQSLQEQIIHAGLFVWSESLLTFARDAPYKFRDSFFEGRAKRRRLERIMENCELGEIISTNCRYFEFMRNWDGRYSLL